MDNEGALAKYLQGESVRNAELKAKLAEAEARLAAAEYRNALLEGTPVGQAIAALEASLLKAENLAHERGKRLVIVEAACKQFEAENARLRLAARTRGGKTR